MFERRWLFQLALIIGVGMMVRGAYRTLLGDTSKIQSVEVAGLEEPVVIHPMHWSNIPRGHSPLTPIAHHDMMNPTITLAKPAIPNVPLSGAKPAVAKADDKTKKKKEAPKTAATLPAPLFNPAQNPAAANPANAANGPTAAAGSQALGAAPVQAAAGGFAAAGAGGATTSLTSQQVMSELFPNGFTQDGMTKLLALKNSGKVTADVYYQVVSQAATSSNPATQSLAVTALEAVPGAEAFTILATMLEKSPSSTVSSQVNAALSQYQSTQMLAYLATPIASTDSTIRYQALLQLNAGAQAVLTQLTSIATSSASNPTRTTASANVQSFFSSYVILLQQLEKTETNQQNMQEETTTLAAINQLMGTASAVQAFARR